MTDSFPFFDLVPVVDDMYPADKYDILLTDVNSTDIHEGISKKLNIEYLSNSHSAELKEVKGIIFGLNYRIFLSLPVKIKKEIKNIHFLFDTGSPRTYICEEAFSSFKATIVDRTYKTVLVNNRPIIALPPPPGSHFTDVNLLGMDYLQTFHAKVTMDFENEQFSFFFGKLSLGEQSIGEQGENLRIIFVFRIDI
ncbi:17771_t:CDS:2 [Funneliformis caledonium]|uniref:17771_t:CDS:1 n=1 Tax=Funneliformis caledonium TaxID=1117310 RepID=A0A9N8VF07_9GLOM|nr:17771_t:CDS:2 [Funneliformis caledonium]